MTAELKRLLALERYRNLAVLEQLRAREMRVHPWKEALRGAVEQINRGRNVYQQFNCSRCGTKQTMDTANTFYQHGICEECGHDTNIQEAGFNYMVTIGVP